MHSLIHTEYAKAAVQPLRPKRDERPETRPHSPPGSIRAISARTLAGLASRLDRESARRVVA